MVRYCGYLTRRNEPPALNMIEFLLTGLVPSPPQLIFQPPEPEPITTQQTEPPEPSLEDKIKNNFYKCNTDTHWIRADNATCLIKPVYAPPPAEPIHVPAATEKAVRQPVKSSNGLNGYDYPSCTGHVALKRYVPPGWGNAYEWLGNARSSGYTISDTPVAGSIGWRGNHVVYVEAVYDSHIRISENNYDYNGSTRTIDRPHNYYTYIY